MLRQFDQMSALRQWLVKRVERGLPLPDSMEETTELVRVDPTGFPAKKFRCVSAVSWLGCRHRALTILQRQAAPILSCSADTKLQR